MELQGRTRRAAWTFALADGLGGPAVSTSGSRTSRLALDEAEGDETNLGVPHTAASLPAAPPAAPSSAGAPASSALAHASTLTGGGYSTACEKTHDVHS